MKFINISTEKEESYFINPANIESIYAVESQGQYILRMISGSEYQLTREQYLEILQ